MAEKTKPQAPAAAKPETAAEPSALDTGKETFRTIVAALLIALVIRTFAFEPFNIPSGSMIPTLLVGDYLFVSKFSYGYGSNGTFWGLFPFKGRIFGSEPHRGDVIVFKLPRDPSIDYIKRVIGLPGDTVQMRQGILYVNNVPVERDRLAHPVAEQDTPYPANAVDYLEHLPDGPTHVIRTFGDNQPLDNTKVFVVPPGHYFFMGDNRDNSSDSRDPRSGVGFVPAGDLVGKADFIFFSIDPGTPFWEFWTWPWTVRWSRLFTTID
ncbi:MAG: signal peptidase I [Alphaproteobacteria bacterium]|nr:signal peptidase I [Alphaproteobacteria bacterium]